MTIARANSSQRASLHAPLPGPVPRSRPSPRAPLPPAPQTPASPSFAAAEVHGLRNPLAGIRASVQLAQFEAASGSELAAFLREALAEVDQLDERLCALMTLHRQEPVKPRTFDLEHLLERVARALASRCEAQAVRLSWQIDAGLRFVEADLSILEEALLELGQNALRASPHGGTLHFSARWTGAHSEIRVEDAGTGVAPSIRHRIFEPFFTTHPGGSGIGLASMRLRLEQAGASLVLESSSAAGSCFLLCLPRLDG